MVYCKNKKGGNLLIKLQNIFFSQNSSLKSLVLNIHYSDILLVKTMEEEISSIEKIKLKEQETEAKLKEKRECEIFLSCLHICRAHFSTESITSQPRNYNVRSEV